MERSGVTPRSDALLDLVTSGVRVFDLGRPLFAGMPQSPSHPPFRMVLQRRHGDAVRGDGVSGSSELLVTGGHMGTHIDALSHVSHNGKLFGGVDAEEAQRGGAFSTHGIETVAPMVCRGVLLDIPKALGIDICEGGYEVTPDDLEAAASKASIAPGDVVLVRTGWGRLWDDRDAFVGFDSGVPGPAQAGAEWLAARKPLAVGGETVAFEHVPAGKGHSLLPAHKVLLVDHGIHIIEMLDLSELATAGITEFVFVLSPLKLVGATGSPIRPLAIVSGA